MAGILENLQLVSLFNNHNYQNKKLPGLVDYWINTKLGIYAKISTNLAKHH